MTFTLDLTAPFSDLTRVRLALGDVTEATAMFSDALILAQIDDTGSWEMAAVHCLRTLIAEMSAVPNYQADWLRVDVATALMQLRAQLVDLENRLSTGPMLATATVQVERADYAEE